MTITEIERDIIHMEDRMIDYSEKLLSVNKKHRQVHELLLKQKVKDSINVVDDMIIDLILLKNWLRHENNKQI
jgi:hypothetical protein